jgi:hypothetical protein
MIEMTMQRGDVYAIPIQDGHYGAIRVLRHGDGSYLIYVSTYLEKALPDLQNPILRSILVQNRFSYENELAIGWRSGKFPPSFVHVGTLDLTSEEEALNSNSNGTLSERTGLEAMWEWRYIHDREALTKEFDEGQARLFARMAKRRHKPKLMLNEELFWPLIAQLNPIADTEEETINRCVQQLAKLTVVQIQRFQESLAFKLYQLDTREHAKHIGLGAFKDDNKHFSADNFLYARCATVAQGMNFYEQALKDPVRMLQNKEMESILGIAEAAFEMRTGREMNYETGCSYETYSNADGWK